MTKAEAPESDRQSVRLVAFYLPQYHPFPENDAWWGKGFTEWTNVTRGKPSFVGHYQPHLPADLGFYDLRLPEIRHQQMDLAKAYGVDAFCYYFYWFAGKRLMERPLDDMLADPAADLPFCLCWANENWTRRWDSRDHEILIAQDYRPEQALESIRALEVYLRDDRYLTLDGKKVVLVYRPQELPDAAAWMQVWRDHARATGLGELHLVSALVSGNSDYKRYGFDSGVQFPPHNKGTKLSDVQKELGFFGAFRGDCSDYWEVGESFLNQQNFDGPDVFLTVFPSWDNTARRKERASIFLNGTPENYEYWLHRAIEKTRTDHPNTDRLVFINAWNEWAEGCHLEPDQRHGLGFLEATRRAKNGSDLVGWTHKGVGPDLGKDAQQAAVSASGSLRSSRSKHHSPLRKGVRALRGFLRRIKGAFRR